MNWQRTWNTERRSRSHADRVYLPKSSVKKRGAKPASRFFYISRLFVQKCSLFTDNERALYVENEISPKLLLFLGNSTNDIIIFDAMLGFLDVGFKSPEAPSDGETE